MIVDEDSQIRRVELDREQVPLAVAFRDPNSPSNVRNVKLESSMIGSDLRTRVFKANFKRATNWRQVTKNGEPYCKVTHGGLHSRWRAVRLAQQQADLPKNAPPESTTDFRRGARIQRRLEIVVQDHGESLAARRDDLISD